MSTHHINPENALRKAEEYDKHGLSEAACEPLLSILNSRRYRQWQPTHEKIMEKFIDLAIKLKRNMREPLVKYRLICSDNNVASLEMIINLYREKTEARAEEARKVAEEKNIDESSADFEESPGSIMLQAVSGENAKDRQGQQILTPWVKYLWEGYRTILEILKNNGKMQVVYQTTARCAFNFCQKFKRPVEFRRLCDMLRKHLVTITKYQNQNNSVDLNSGDTQRMYLETRFQQLEIASSLELWQEAYRTIEDIHENMLLAKTTQTPTLMKTYYYQLSQIFWASGNHLFHAYSLFKYYALRCNEGFEGNEKKELATCVLLATLSIEPSSLSASDGAFTENEENLRLASMLGFRKETPTRARLIQGLVSKGGLLSQVSEASAAIYHLTEEAFGPLVLKKKMDPLLKELQAAPEAVSKYVTPLKKLAVLRILQQLSGVFKTMKFSSIAKIVPETPFYEIEMIIMDAARFNHLSIRVDHRSKLLLFHDQDMESQRVRNQLKNMASSLQKVVIKLDGASAEDKAQERKHVFQSVERGVAEEHNQVFLRKQEIEKRKQEHETRLAEKEKRDEEIKQEARRQRQEEEKVRLELEQKKREEEKKKREEDERELQAKKKLALEIEKTLEAAANKSKAARKLQQMTQKVEEVDKEAILDAQAALVKSQQAEADRKIKEQNKRLDYMTRALRHEEKELLVTSQEVNEKLEQEQHKLDFEKFEETHKLQHTKSLEEKVRLSRMESQRNVFFKKIVAEREAIFKVEKEAQEKRLESKRLVREEQERERDAKYMREEKERKAEEAERKRVEDEEQEEAEAKAAQEEDEREAKAAKEAADKEAKLAKAAAEKERRDEERTRLDEGARKQHEKEAEMEAREQSGREAPRVSDRGGGDRGALAGRREEREEGGGDKWRSSRGDAPPRGTDRPSDDRMGGRGERSGFGGRAGDRDGGERSGFGRPSDRDGGERSGFGRPSDRDGGERSGFGRPSDRDGGERSGFGRPSDRDGGERSGFGGRAGDRDGGERGGRPSDRDGGERSGFGGRAGDRDGGRAGDRDGGERSGFGGRGGERDGGERSGFGGRAGDRDGGRAGDRDGGERSGFGGRREEREDTGDKWRSSAAPRVSDRGDARGGDRGDPRGADRGDARGMDRGDARGGDRGDARGGDRGDARGGDRPGRRDENRDEGREWRRDPAEKVPEARKREERPAAEKKPEPRMREEQPAEEEDDGFQTVKKKKGGR